MKLTARIRRFVTRRPSLALFALGCFVPLMVLLIVTAHGIPLEEVGDPGTYTQPTVRWMETGTFSALGVDNQTVIPYFGRQMGYPLLIAVFFKLFGIGHYFPLALAQVLLTGLTVVFTGWIAARIRSSWFWPAGIAMALCLNYGFRAATIMPETLFTFQIAGGLAALLWSLDEDRRTSQRTWGLRIASGALFAWALLTRVAFLPFAVALLPGLAVYLRVSLKMPLKRVARTLGIPALFLAVAAGGQLWRAHSHFGVFSFTTEGGHNLAIGLYPCLMTSTGCGNRNTVALDKVESEINEAVAALPPEKRLNPFVVDHAKKEIALRHLREVPIVSGLRALIGGELKLMLHSSFYELAERFRLSDQRVYWSEYSSKPAYFRALFASPLMLAWLLMQLGVFALRVLQLLGCWVLLRDPKTRIYGFILIVGTAALVLAPISFGNPRYRAPVEPLLAVLAIAGLSRLKPRWF